MEIVTDKSNGTLKLYTVINSEKHNDCGGEGVE